MEHRERWEKDGLCEEEMFCGPQGLDVGGKRQEVLRTPRFDFRVPGFENPQSKRGHLN